MIVFLVRQTSLSWSSLPVSFESLHKICILKIVDRGNEVENRTYLSSKQEIYQSQMFVKFFSNKGFPTKLFTFFEMWMVTKMTSRIEIVGQVIFYHPIFQKRKMRAPGSSQCRWWCEAWGGVNSPRMTSHQKTAVKV